MADTETKTEDSPRLEEMAREGLIFGRKKAKTDPKMREFIFSNRNGFELFDLQKTDEKLEEAKNFLKEVAKSGKQILFVGTTAAAAESTRALAEKFESPFVVHRWLGGTLTNYETINTRLQYYIKLKNDQASGRLEKYTKKERTKFDKELGRLATLFGGLEAMKEMPGAIVVINAKAHDIAVKEANIAKVPIVAVINTDTDPDMIDHPIPANDNSRSSVSWILAELEQALSTK